MMCLQLDTLHFNLSCCDSRKRTLDPNPGFRDSPVNDVCVGRRIEGFLVKRTGSENCWASCVFAVGGHKCTSAEVWQFKRALIALPTAWLATPESSARRGFQISLRSTRSAWGVDHK